MVKSPSISLSLSILAALGLLAAAGCGRWASSPPATDLVLMISIDTLRPDDLGCYGYGPDTSPHLDALAADSVLFSETLAHASSTLSSHASMLTSSLPPQHGASFARKTALRERVRTLSEILGEEGFATASFNDGGQLDARFGLDRGFEVYESFETDTFAPIVSRAIEWLEGRGGKPAFLFLHTYQTHHPYRPKKWRLELFDRGYSGPLRDRVSVDLLKSINDGRLPISAEDLAHIRAAYDAEILGADFELGRLIDHLKASGLYDRALIVFTSDHGEEFGEHESVGWHGHTLYEELLRVPLLIKLPGSRDAGRRVRPTVRLIDLAPTILELLGRPIPETFHGASLLPLIEGRAGQDRPAVAVLDHEIPEINQSIRSGRWKLNRTALFDLESDPGERADLAAEHPEIVARLQAELAEQLGATEPGEERPVDLDEETRKRLEALGYAG